MTHQDCVLIEKAKQLLLNIFNFGLHGSQTFCREPTEPAGEEGGGAGGGGGGGERGRGERGGYCFSNCQGYRDGTHTLCVVVHYWMGWFHQHLAYRVEVHVNHCDPSQLQPFGCVTLGNKNKKIRVEEGGGGNFKRDRLFAGVGRRRGIIPSHSPQSTQLGCSQAPQGLVEPAHSQIPEPVVLLL